MQLTYIIDEEEGRSESAGLEYSLYLTIYFHSYFHIIFPYKISKQGEESICDKYLLANIILNVTLLKCDFIVSPEPQKHVTMWQFLNNQESYN